MKRQIEDLIYSCLYTYDHNKMKGGVYLVVDHHGMDNLIKLLHINYDPSYEYSISTIGVNKHASIEKIITAFVLQLKDYEATIYYKIDPMYNNNLFFIKDLPLTITTTLKQQLHPRMMLFTDNKILDVTTNYYPITDTYQPYI